MSWNSIVSMDFASLYPSSLSGLKNPKIILRKIKLKKILNKINDGKIL